MRLLLSLLITPLLRSTSPVSAVLTTATARRFSTLPPLTYPVCRRNFTCAAPFAQDFTTIMADLKTEELEQGKQMAEPAFPCKGESSGDNAGSEAAHKAVDAGGKKGKAGEEVKDEETLPKLSAAEFRAYNSMAEHMEYFHNHFRQSWNVLHTACVSNKRPASLSLKAFITTGLQFISHLTMHHSIEEQHIFPLLARRMPEFKSGKNAAELLRQHREIHAGMDVFEEYLKKCKSGEVELELRVLREKMDSWGDVLWKHLDQEVKTLGAENMRRYWTIEEMRRMPM